MALHNSKLKRIHWFLGVLTLTAMVMFFAYSRADSIVIQGIPLNILWMATSDLPTVEAYLRGDKVALHQRLQDKGVEEAIKAYYRPRIRNEKQLDQYIHQLFYELSGYVGVAYRVNDQGILELRQPTPNPEQQRWVSLALKLGVISRVTHQDGVDYVTNPDGTQITYAQASRLLPLTTLEQLNQLNRPVPVPKP